MHFDSNEWIHDFFMHFFETFNDVCNQTKDQIINLQKRIDSLYIINEFKIDELAEEANVAVDDYDGVDQGSKFKQISVIQTKIRTKWNNLKRTIGIRLREIVDQVDEPDKRSDWYCSLKKLNEIYVVVPIYLLILKNMDSRLVDRKSMSTMEEYFLEEKFCGIGNVACKDQY